MLRCGNTDDSLGKLNRVEKNSGLYKSTDAGATWKKMKTGLPKDFGKAGISVSRANSEVVYAVIEAKDKKGGVYRSNNAGKTWKQVNSNRVNIARSWYYMEIFADPQNENVWYVLNAPVMNPSMEENHLKTLRFAWR